MASKNIENTNVKERVVKIESAESIIGKKEEEKKPNHAYLFGKAFGERLRSDKIFLLSFLITLVFIAFFSYKRLKNSESSYPSIINRIMSNNEESTQNEKKVNKNVSVDEKLDISDYVGIYSREVLLNDKVKLSDSCVMDSYKFVYQIKKDKSINKFLYNSCLGAIKMWDDELDYITIDGTKYIGTKNDHFLFSGTSMREVDGETYKIDDEFVSIKERNKINGLNVYFYDTSVVFMSDSNLLLMRGNSLLFDLNSKYPSNGGTINKRVYYSKDVFNFIVFYNGEGLNCYKDQNTNDELVYKIYSTSYNKDNALFDEPKELISRTKADGCQYWKEDLNKLAN